MTQDEERILLEGLVFLKRQVTLLGERINALEVRFRQYDGNPMCPLCRETFTTTEAFINHYKRRHP